VLSSGLLSANISPWLKPLVTLLKFRGTVAAQRSLAFSKADFTRHFIFSDDDVILSADTKSIVETRTLCTALVDKNVQNRTFYNSIGG